MSFASRVRDAKAKGGPRFLDQRFDGQKHPVSCAGNTIICHIIDPTALDAICAAQDALKNTAAGDCFAWLPKSSLHCTLFNGLVYGERQAALWPTTLANDATRREADDHIKNAYDAVEPPKAAQMAPDGFSGAQSDAIGISLKPCAQSETALRSYRDELAKESGLTHRPGHAAYIFHITLGYLVKWPDEDAAQAFDQASAEVMQTLQTRLPTLTLDRAEYCTFADLTHFEVLASKP